MTMGSERLGGTITTGAVRLQPGNGGAGGGTSMRMSQSLANQFFADAETDGREPNRTNLAAWLWFTCPANMRTDVESVVLKDRRFVRRPGRPVGPEGERSVLFRLRLTPEERKRLDDMAAEQGVTPSQLVRKRVFEE